MQVKADINKQLWDRRRELSNLGSSRETKEQQHRYLLELAARFQKLTSLALSAHYGGDEVFDQVPMLKLATMVVRRNELFSNDVAVRGHTVQFGSQTDAGEGSRPDAEDGSQSDAGDGSQSDSGDSESEGSSDGSEGSYSEENSFEFNDKAPLLLAAQKPKTANRYTKNHDDLYDVLQPNSNAAKPQNKNIIKWLEVIYTGCRGFELGTFDASIIPIIWKKQSAYWEDIALGYISDIVSLVHSFIVGLLQACCADDMLADRLLSVLADHIIGRYGKAIDHTNFLLQVERAGTPLTANHYFADNLEKW